MPEKNAGTVRNSGIEALKLITAFMIVLSHTIPCDGSDSLPSFIPLHIASLDANVFLLLLIRYLGQFGNAVFVIASAWFLAEDDRIKAGRVRRLLYDTLLINWIYAGGVLLAGCKPLPGEKLTLWMPLTHESNWFVTCYLLLYILHPWLNAILRHIGRIPLRRGLVFLLFLYGIWQPVFAGSMFYTKLAGVILVYLITGFCRKYPDALWPEKKDRLIALSAIVLIPAFVFLCDLAGLTHWYFQAKMADFCTLVNPLVLFPSMALFRISARRQTTHPRINALASLTLPVYLISENYVMRRFLRPEAFYRIYLRFGYSHIVLICLLAGTVVFLVSLLLAALWRSLAKILFRGRL